MLSPLPRCSSWASSSLIHPAVSAFPDSTFGSARISTFSRFESFADATANGKVAPKAAVRASATKAPGSTLRQKRRSCAPARRSRSRGTPVHHGDGGWPYAGNGSATAMASFCRGASRFRIKYLTVVPHAASLQKSSHNSAPLASLRRAPSRRGRGTHQRLFRRHGFRPRRNSRLY